MQTTTDEIADGIYRIATFVPDAGMSFNQILVTGEEPLLFHTGMRALFPLTSDAVARVMPIDQLRWISFGHVEADESGALNEWLVAAPSAQVAFGELGCMVSVNDLADRPPRGLVDRLVIDVRQVDDVTYLVAVMLEHLLQDVDHEQATYQADVRQVVQGGATGVDAHLPLLEGSEVHLAPGQCVVESDHWVTW